MPELPEVETVVNSLKSKLINRKIIDVEIRYPHIIASPSAKEFKNSITCQKINNIKRRGKYIMFELDNYYLLSHLRMEGKYFFKTKEDEVLKHEHIIFTLDNKVELRYADTRKFGRMYLIKKEDIDNTPPLNKLGLEPFANNLTSTYLYNKYKNKKLPIKSVLLDQSIIVGIGNIYADEILFASKINPYKKCCALTKKELDSIIENTRKVLKLAILKGGTTIRSYTSVDGVSGSFQDELLVHCQSRCPVCKCEIAKVYIGGRGTYYCPKCQKIKKESKI